MRNQDAIDVALALTLKPGQHRREPGGQLPANMLDVIKLAAEHAETVERYCRSKGVNSQLLLDSARLYLQTIILESGQDHHRALALAPTASAEQIRDHKRLLLKWLHPDRNRNSWESGLFLRVQRAAEELDRKREVETVAAPVLPQTKKNSRKFRSPKHSKAAPAFRQRRGGFYNFFRTVALPSLTIAVSAAAIYFAVSHGPSGVFAKDKLISLMQWNGK